MNNRDIVRVWGVADNFDIEFTQIKPGQWKVQVPADLEDGTYAVTIYALNRFDRISSWCGQLFMCKDTCHIEFNQSDYALEFDCAKAMLSIEEDTSTLLLQKGFQRGKIIINEDTSTILFSRSCPHEQE